MNFKQKSFLVLSLFCVTKIYANRHDIILDEGTNARYSVRFFGSEGITKIAGTKYVDQKEVPANYYLKNEIWFGHCMGQKGCAHQYVSSFNWEGGFNRLRYQEIDDKGDITYCEAYLPNYNNGGWFTTYANTQIRLEKGCKVRVWEPKKDYHRLVTWPSTSSKTKPKDWVYPAGQ